ncbi:transposase [Hydrogenovibrio halophilus]|uniref:transposase n=1 Tax=Hydrogenovibrio halophilus TaxID=373391 RepID=UPI00037FA0F7|nr:transposase [Hydrogenovibrio halophilus]
MTRARDSQINLSETPWYHLVNRCVRRAFLCGIDAISGRNYEHRKPWIEQRMMQLASVFAIDVAAFAVMSNHYHLVVRVNQVKAESWSMDEVLLQWTQLFAAPKLVQDYLADPKALSAGSLKRVQEQVEIYRERLMDISWYMRVLNESIARYANQEDEVKGRFWEGRFKSQALLDEQAVLAAMAYVDLNPVRANIARELLDSDFTSVQRRLQGVYHFEAAPEKLPGLVKKTSDKESAFAQPFLERLEKIPTAPLLAFDASGLEDSAIPCSATDYMAYVDFLGRAVHPDKSGHMNENLPPLMQRLGLDDKHMEAFVQSSWLNKFGGAVGQVMSLNKHRDERDQRFVKGQSTARRLFGA